MTFTIEITAEYPVHNFVPPRCYKPRTVHEQMSGQAQVDQVSGSEAPVAFRYLDPIRGTQERRWYEGELYAPYLPHAHQSEPSTPGSKYFPAERSFGAHELHMVDGADEARAWIERRFDAYLIIDDEVWVQCGEPVYVVMTFGFGGNHGGTAIMVTEIWRGATNSNIRRRAYWNANEYEKARKQAIRWAEDRGDTESIARFDDATYNIQVLIDEAVRFVHIEAD